MPTYTTGVLVNLLTKVDAAFHASFHNQLTVYPADSRGREQVISARMTGLDEEFQAAEYPFWVINPFDVQLDMRRFREEAPATVVDSHHKRKAPADLAYLAQYVVNGYAQDARVFREMQLFAALLFRPFSFISTTSPTANHYVDQVSIASNVDLVEKEYVLQLSYQVWVEFAPLSYTDYPTVWNNIIVGYTVGQGRFIQSAASEEDQVISP